MLIWLQPILVETSGKYRSAVLDAGAKNDTGYVKQTEMGSRLVHVSAKGTSQ
jgi:hypothetical protein